MEDVPETGAREVLIRVGKTAICGTDVHINLRDSWAEMTIKPVPVCGHERSAMIHNTPIDSHEYSFRRMRHGECVKVVCNRTGSI